VSGSEPWSEGGQRLTRERGPEDARQGKTVSIAPSGEKGLKRRTSIVLIAFLVAMAIGWLFLLSHWSQCSVYLKDLALHGNIDRLKCLVLSYGAWAPLISAALMVGQSVILFLPAFPIFVVNALAFGLLWGLLLSWSSAVLGSITCFAIAKTLGRPVVHRLVNRVHLETADAALRRYEKYVILFFGFVPVISFDVISYAAGLTLLTYWEFIPLVCIAQIPSALFYSLLVHKIDQGTLDVYWGVAAGLFFLLGIGSLAVRSYLGRRRRKEISHARL
jgi:uncharacterized membrane protein YdjX (TVP38/TMEM64 family)